MLRTSLQFQNVSQAAFEQIPLLLTLPQILLLLFGYRQGFKFIFEDPLLVFQVDGINEPAIGQQPWKYVRSAGMEDGFVRNKGVLYAIFIIEHFLHARSCIFHRGNRDWNISVKEIRHLLLIYFDLFIIYQFIEF